MRKSHIIFVLGVILTALCATAFADEAQTAAPAGVVNINTADVAQLSYLPRVGAKAAQRIVDYRTQHGPFKSTADLMQVKGFGQKTFDRISSYLTVEGKTTLDSKIQSPRKPRAKTARQTSSNPASK